MENQAGIAAIVYFLLYFVAPPFIPTAINFIDLVLSTVFLLTMLVVMDKYNFLTWFIYLEYFLFGFLSWIFALENGIWFFVGTVCIFIKQKWPETRKYSPCKYKHFPLLLFVACLLTLFTRIWALSLKIILSMILTWSYARFYRYYSNGIRGDLNPSFSFVSFFPVTFQPVAEKVSNIFYSKMREYELVPDRPQVELEEGMTRTTDRRRNRALKELESILQ